VSFCDRVQSIGKGCAETGLDYNAGSYQQAVMMTSKQDRPLDTGQQPLDGPCNLFFLRSAARAVNRQYAAVMKDCGLHPNQFSLLFILDKTGPLSITELASKMQLDRTSMSRNLNPLNKQGLISIAEEGWHRTRAVSLTAEGSAVLQKGMPLWKQAQREFAGHMGQADTAALMALLIKASAIPAQYPPVSSADE
jgi:DNA-binding MarR family transcriptional regulator